MRASNTQGFSKTAKPPTSLIQRDFDFGALCLEVVGSCVWELKFAHLMPGLMQSLEAKPKERRKNTTTTGQNESKAASAQI